MVPVCLHGDYTHQLGVLLGNTSDSLSEIFQWNYGSLKPGCHTQRIIWWTLAGRSNCEMLNTTMPGGLFTLHTSLYSYVIFTLFLCTKVSRGAWKAVVLMCIDTYIHVYIHIHIVLKVMQRSRKKQWNATNIFLCKTSFHPLPPATSAVEGRTSFNSDTLVRQAWRAACTKWCILSPEALKVFEQSFLIWELFFYNAIAALPFPQQHPHNLNTKKTGLWAKKRLKEQ